MGRLFGTDGARGVAITELTCERAMQIGRAAAMVLTRTTHHKPKILIGKDTRISSDVLEAALVAGICSVGADAVILGVVPTPAVAYLVKKREADAGVMISASHNSMEFNGIKLFSGKGYKLSDDIEEEIESLVLDAPEKIAEQMTGGANIGRISYDKNAEWDNIRYIMKNKSCCRLCQRFCKCYRRKAFQRSGRCRIAYKQYSRRNKYQRQMRFNIP